MGGNCDGNGGDGGDGLVGFQVSPALWIGVECNGTGTLYLVDAERRQRSAFVYRTGIEALREAARIAAQGWGEPAGWVGRLDEPAALAPVAAAVGR